MLSLLSEFFCMSNSASKQSQQLGVTLLELMLSLLISSMVLASFLLVSKGFSATATDFQKDIRTQLGIRSFMELINSHASQAGYSPPDTLFTVGIKTLNPFYLNGSSSNPGVQVDVASLKFVFDSSVSAREFTQYDVVANTRKGRAEKKVVLTHYYTNPSGVNTTVLATPQDVLMGVKDFKCSFRAIGGTPRALDCFLSVYKDFDPSVVTLDYEFTLATTQSF